jgi:hypothetical protein
MTITMEPLVIRGRRPARAVPAAQVVMEPVEIRARPLTNRAAGRLRDEPDRLAFGGFGYTRTAQDDADVAAAVRARRREATPAATSTPAPAPPAAGPQPPAPVAGAIPVEPAAGGAAATPSVPAPAAPPDAVATGVRAPAATPPTGIQTPEQLAAAGRAAAGALPHPDLPRPALGQVLGTVVMVRGSGRAAPGRGGGGGSGGPPPRPVEPIEIDPVPKATEALTAALNERLPELVLPALTPMPDGTVPTLPEVKGVAEDELAVEVDLEGPAGAAKKVNTAEDARTRAAAKPPAEADPPVKPKPLSPPVLLDFRRPPLPPPPKADADLTSAHVTRVLALLKADVADRATALVEKIRTQAFPNLGHHFGELTRPLHDQIRKGLQEKVDELQRAARITDEALAAAVAARQAELTQKVTRTVTAAELVVDESARKLTRQAELELARQERQRLQEQARVVARYRRALHAHDPALVEELVTARLGYIDADVSAGMVAITAASERRTALIDQYEGAYQQAYDNADDAWQHPPGREPRAPPNTKDGKVWLYEVSDELAASMEDLRAGTAADAATLASGLTKTGRDAKRAVRDWSDKRLRRTLTGEQQAARAATDQKAADEATSRAETAAKEAKTVGELTGLIGYASAAYLKTEAQTQEAGRTAGEAVAKQRTEQESAFLKLGEPSDPMTAVANYQVVKYEREKLAGKPKELQDEIYAKEPKDHGEARDLGNIYFPDGGGGLEDRVNRLWTAFQVWHGTAEEDAIGAMQGLNAHQARLLRMTYRIHKHEDLDQRIKDEMSGADRQMALGLATGDKAMYAKGVIADSDGIFSSDPNRALDAVRDLPPGEAATVVADPDTREHLQSVLGGGARFAGQGKGWVKDDRGMAQLDLLVQLNSATPTAEQLKTAGGRTPAATTAELRDLQAQADAVEFDRIVRRGTGAEAPDLTKMFDRIREQVQARAPPGWSAEQIDNEIRRRIRAMENSYEEKFGSELPANGVSAMRTAVAQYSYGTTLDLRTALLDVNRAGERATRLQRTTEGLYTTDSELNTELERTYKEALAEVQRNTARRAQVETRAAELMAKDGVPGPGRAASPRELAAYRTEAEQEVARGLATTWMGEVGTAFAAKYGHRWGGGPDALRTMIASQTQFGGEREALDRLANGGGLTDAQKVKHGVSGRGMEAKLVLEGIGGRTRKQLDRIGAEYKADPYNEGEDMVTRLTSESGGWTDTTGATHMEREGFDIREALRGVATTPDEEFQAAQRRFEYERDVYFGGAGGRPSEVSAEFASLQRQMDGVTRAHEEYKAALARGDSVAVKRLEVSISVARDSVGVSAEAYRKAVDEHVEGVAQKVAIGVALAVVAVVAVATSILTGGAAAPAWVAVATAVGASVLGTAASIAVKNHMLGAAYSSSQLQTDLIVGAVDAIIAGLTAGLGDKLLKLPKVAGGTKAMRILASRAAAAQKASRPLLARAAAFTAEQVAQAVPTAVTGSLLNRDTWRGDPLRNLSTSAGLAAITGIGAAGALHAGMSGAGKLLGGVGEAIRIARGGTGSSIEADAVTLGSSRRALAADHPPEGPLSRGSWLERWAAKREYLRAHPDATEFDFDLALATGRARADVDAAVVRRLHADLIGNLVSGLSREEAELVRHARVQVVPDAEFVRRTGSGSSGHAATVNVKGEPVVLIREGAPLSALREEGLHVAQFLDPKNVERLTLLEEGRLANWSSLSLTDRITAWRAKIDLEVDAQRRLIPQLEAELGRPDLHPERARDLMARLEDAEDALEVLSGRGRTLAALDPAELARMQRGDLSPPPGLEFLDDPARLFAKKGTGKTLPPGPAKGTPVGMAEAGPDTATSTLEDLPGGRLREVGRAFPHNGKEYRFVRILAADGSILDTLIERRVGTAWHRSGRGNRPRGGIAELAEQLERKPTLGREGDTTRLTVDAREQGSEKGFDNVVLSFQKHPDGTWDAGVTVVEVKSYFEAEVRNFGAIRGNFDTNLARLRERLQAQLAELQANPQQKVSSLGLTREQLSAALATVDRRRIDIQIRVPEGTRVSETTLAGIRDTVNARKGSSVSVALDPNRITAESLAAAERFWDTIEAYRLLGPEHPDAQLFRALANGPQGMSPETIQIADAVVAARNARPPLLEGLVRWSADRTHLVDANGPFVLVAPTTDAGMAAAAADIVAKARARVGNEKLRVVVDELNLSDAERRELHNLVTLALRADPAALARILSMDLSRPLGVR